MNPETRVCRATKRTFVEEVSVMRLRGGGIPRRSISDEDMLENIEFSVVDEIPIAFEFEVDHETDTLQLMTAIPVNEDDTSLDAEIITWETNKKTFATLNFKPPFKLPRAHESQGFSLYFYFQVPTSNKFLL